MRITYQSHPHRTLWGLRRFPLAYRLDLGTRNLAWWRRKDRTHALALAAWLLTLTLAALTGNL